MRWSILLKNSALFLSRGSLKVDLTYLRLKNQWKKREEA